MRPPRPQSRDAPPSDPPEEDPDKTWVLYIQRDNIACEEAVTKLHDLMRGLPVTLRIEDITDSEDDPYLDSVPILEDPDQNIVWIEFFDLERTWEAWVSYLTRQAHEERAPIQVPDEMTA